MFFRIFILSITLIILSIITFHEIIIKKLFISTLEKATEKAISIDNININFNESLFTLHNIKIYNSSDFENEFFFTSKKIVLKLNLSSIFTKVIEFQDLIFHEPKIYLEIKNQLNFDKKDNISELEKYSPNYEPKVYNVKKKDKNILIKKVLTIKPRASLKFENTYKIENLKLSEMEFQNVGNTLNSQHFKEVFKLLLLDLYFRIPNQNIKAKLKKIYKF